MTSSTGLEEAGGATRPSAKERRRTRISDAATALFFERGFDAVSIAEIAEAAGVSKMTVTNHFALKEDLVFDEFEDDIRLLRDALRGVGSLAEAIDAVEGYCALRERVGGLSRVLSTENATEATAAFAGMVLASRALTQRFHSHYLELRDVIAEALPAGERLAAWLLAETVHFIDWRPFEAAAGGRAAAAIRRERRDGRAHAFRVLRAGLLVAPEG